MLQAINHDVPAEELEVLRATIHETYPPTNPAVILRALRSWYLAFGADEVYKRGVAWLGELSDIKTYDTTLLRAAEKAFAAKTERITTKD